MKAVLDASALLAYLQEEPGSSAVDAVLSESVISSVNWAEVVQKSLFYGVQVDGLRADLGALGLGVLAFTPEEAEMAGRLWQKTRLHGLSLGHRACLSLGLRLDLPVLTTDRVWLEVNLAVEVYVLR